MRLKVRLFETARLPTFNNGTSSLNKEQVNRMSLIMSANVRRPSEKVGLNQLTFHHFQPMVHIFSHGTLELSRGKLVVFRFRKVLGTLYALKS